MYNALIPFFFLRRFVLCASLSLFFFGRSCKSVRERQRCLSFFQTYSAWHIFFLHSHPYPFKSTAGSLSRIFELVFRNHLSAISTIFNGFLKHIRAHTHTHGKKKKRENQVYTCCVFYRTHRNSRFFLISPLPFVIIIIDFSRSPSPLFHGFYLKSTHAHIHT